MIMGSIMRISKILAVLFSIVLLFTLPNINSYAQSNNELFDLYKEFFEDKTAIALKDYTVDGYNSMYTVVEKPNDYGVIQITTDYEIKFTAEELSRNTGVSVNDFSISNTFYKIYRQYSLIVDLHSIDHELNKDIFTKIYTSLKEKYDIFSACIFLDSVPVSVNHSVSWDSFIKTDEFGYEVTSDEYLSENKINNIRRALVSNNFPATIDNDGKIIFDESVSEIEKFVFALWFKKEYDFCPLNKLSNYSKEYSKTEVVHYTELLGDVNNDNYVNSTDMKALEEYILSGSTDYARGNRPYICFNIKNADLTEDGVIDAFDLVLLRKQI